MNWQGFRAGTGFGLAVWWLLLAAAYSALTAVSLLFAEPGVAASPLWLPAGLALAALLRFGLRLWPGVALGMVVAALLVKGSGIGYALLLSAAVSVEALFAAWLIRLLVDRRLVLQHIADIFRFTLVALVAPLPMVLIGAAAVTPAVQGGAELSSLLSRWWLGDVSGILVFTPFALGWTRREYAPPAGRGSELALFVALVLLASTVVFGGWLPTGSLVFALLGFFLWAGLRLAVRGFSALNLLVGVSAAYYTGQGVGPFLAPSPLVTQLTLQAFLVVIVVAGLIFIAIMHERGEALEELRLSDRILNASPEHISVVTPQHTYRRVNCAYERAHNRPVNDIVGMRVADLLGRDIYEQVVRPNLDRCFAGNEIRYSAWFNFEGEGRRHMLVTYLPLFSSNGNHVDGVAVLSRDVTDIKVAEEQLQLAGQVIENTPEGVMITDADLRILSVNPAFCRNTGYSAEEIIGQTPSVLSSGRHDQAFYQRMWEQLVQHGHWQGEIWNRRRNGDIYVEWLSIVVIRDSTGAISHYAGLFSDITSQEHVRSRLHSLAYYDALTDLPNRELFNDRLHNALAQARREQRQVALMFLDLDRFKLINDSLGHFVGDGLLKAVAEILRRCVRESDTVARLGGDEFTIIVGGVTTPEDVLQVARKIVESFEPPIPVAGHDLQVTTSIGIAIYPYDGADAQALLRNADAAMYGAKQSGRNTYLLFEPKMAELLRADRTHR